LDATAPQTVLAEKVQKYGEAHIRAFYDCVRNAAKSPADVTISAPDALAAIQGNEVCRQDQVIEWKDLGVGVWSRRKGRAA
jgi:hypothetical protein